MADLQGKLVANWPVINGLLATALEPGAQITGDPRPFHLRGALAGESLAATLRGLEAELAIDRVEAVALGVRLAPTPIVLRASKGNVAIDPIDTTINGGRTAVRAAITVDEKGAIVLWLAQSAIEKAEINEDVSHKLLTYIAPVLDGATRVQGKLSLQLDRAAFPLVADPPLTMSAFGRLDFDGVEFVAGDFAGELLSLTGKPQQVALRIDRPVQFALAQGRVTQQGLSVAVGREARLELDGSVGFDGSLALRARVPVTPGKLANQPELQGLLEGLRVGVPITGTLSRPAIDRRALRIGLREAGSSAIKRDVKRNAAEFLDRLMRQESNDAPRSR